MEQLINITDAVFLGHVGEVELGASASTSSGLIIKALATAARCFCPPDTS